MISFKEHIILESITKGININDKKTPWTDMILDGRKTIETRETPSLNAYIGQRVALVRTGKGKAVIVGIATIGEPKHYKNIAEFRADFRKHRVDAGSEFDIKVSKYGYPLYDVQKISNPIPVDSKGIIARNVEGLI